jgi:hypothetical protein
MSPASRRPPPRRRGPIRRFLGFVASVLTGAFLLGMLVVVAIIVGLVVLIF